MSNVLNQIANLYSDNLKNLGAGPNSVGWRDDATHNLRFEKLLSMIDTDHRKNGFTLNDLGCGYGAMIDYMTETAGMKLDHFYGYDISDDMLAEATKRYGQQANVSIFGEKTLTTQADYSVTSGIFNVRFETGNQAWEDYIHSVLHNLHEQSAVGFSFNLLSTYVDYQEPQLYYGDPLHFFDYCKRNFSKKVNLLHDYPLYEWTITVLK